MDFLDPNKKRKHIRRLYLGYALMAVLIGMVTFLVVSLAYGYNFNLLTGEINRNGLMFIDSRPGGAEVIVNGTKKGNTDIRMVAPAGSYDIEINRSGYRGWHRSLTLEGGMVERIVYPFLFPENIVRNDVQLYSRKPEFATQSPDRRWVIVQPPGSLNNFELFDLSQELVIPIPLALPKSSVTVAGDRHRFETVEWSNDNRHLVLKHTHAAGSEFILVDHMEPEKSLNLTALFKQPFTDLMLRDKKFDKYYLLDKTSKTLKAATLSAPNDINLVLDKVLAVRAHGNDELLYISDKSSKKGKVTLYTLFGGKEYVLRDMALDASYLLDIARFDGKWFMVAGSPKESKVYVYKNPVQSIASNSKLLPASIMRMESAETVSFSHSAQFIAVQSGSKFVVYDTETDRNYRYDIDIAAEPGLKATWMDGHRLTLVDKNNKLYAFDYNGINRHDLVSAYQDFKPFFSKDYDFLFHLGPSTGVDGRAAFLNASLEVQETQTQNF